MLNTIRAVEKVLVHKGYQVEQNDGSLRIRFRRNTSQNFYGIIEFRDTIGWFRHGVTGMFLKSRWVEDFKQLDALVEASVAEYESWPP